jgi:hypothetical protein
MRLAPASGSNNNARDHGGLASRRDAFATAAVWIFTVIV